MIDGRKRVEEAGKRGGATGNETAEAMSDSAAGTMGGTIVGATRRGVMIGAGTIGVATTESVRTTAVVTEGARPAGRAEAAVLGTA